MEGREISHYRILAKLGEGGMGVVYKAEDTKLRRAVALKFLRADALDADHQERFLREAQAAAALDHPNICTIHEIDEVDGQTFLAMAFVEGQTVKEKVSGRPLKLEEALDITIQTAEGLRAAHDKGIVHRDIKPANLIVNPYGQVKIMDFGLAQLGDRTRLTKTSTFVGTPAYMSPEQAERQPGDRRADLWSLGAVLYEMVTGRAPFEGEREAAVLHAIVHAEHEPVTALRVGVPTELDRILAKALAKNPSERYQHADDILVDLKHLQASLDPTTKTVSAAPVKPASSRRWVWAIAAACLAALLIVALLNRPAEQVSSPQAMRAVPLTSLPGHEVNPAFSTDGTRVAFSWNGEDGSNFDIYVQVIDAGAPVPLTDHPAQDLDPAWSPDGRYVAFARKIEQDRVAFMQVPALGGQENVITEAYDPAPILRGANHYLTWSSSGQAIIFADRETEREPTGLFLFQLASGQRTRLTRPPDGFQGDVNPSLSPDGSKLVFMRYSSAGAGTIQVLELDLQGMPQGEPSEIVSQPYLIYSPIFTPNSQEIVFSMWAPLPSLWRSDLSGQTPPRRLAGVGDYGTNPTFSADGRMLAYSRRLWVHDIWRLEFSAPAIAAGPPQTWIRSTQDDMLAHYSPDGDKIVFQSNRSGENQIWVCDADGSNPARLTSLESSFTGSPRWSPEGSRIAFDSNASGRFEIYVMNANGGEITRLTDGEVGGTNPRWSPDGEWIYLSFYLGGPQSLRRIPAAGGEPEEIAKRIRGRPSVSADGRYVYFGRADNGLWRVPADGGDEELVLESVGEFTVVAEGVYYTPDTPPFAATDILFYRFADGSVTKVWHSPDSAPARFSTSSDGRFLLFTLPQDVGNDLMLVENFH